MYDAFYADGSEIWEMLIDAQVSCRFCQVYSTVSSAMIVVHVFLCIEGIT